MRATLIFLAAVLTAVIGYALYRGPVFTSASSSPSPAMSSVIAGHLVSADGRPYTFPASAPGNSLKYYALYYSAQWCPPCHTFTPVLVDWYKKFKPAHPDFELIFVSDDHDKASWLGYMKEMAMPWPAFSYDDLQQNGKDIDKFAGSGIPDLVLVDANGKVLADTFTSLGMYREPQNVLPDIEKILGPGMPAAQTAAP